MKWDQSKFLEAELTVLPEEEATYALRKAWVNLFDEEPSDRTLAILFAQTALETGRWKIMRNYNWGNLKSRQDDGHYWTMYECSEVINGREIFFKPPHDQSKFRAYKSSSSGAKDYLYLLSNKSNYKKAFQFLKDGNVIEYTKALKEGGYFTASLNKYIPVMQSITNEFFNKKDRLLQWEPEEPEPESEPKPESKRDTFRSLPLIIPPPPEKDLDSDVPVVVDLSATKDDKINKIRPFVGILGFIGVLIALIYSLFQ